MDSLASPRYRRGFDQEALMMTRQAGRAVLAGMLVAAALAAYARTKTTSTWTDPQAQPKVYAKVLVLARVSEPSAKRILEDKVVQGLNEKNIAAVAAYQVLTEEDLATEESIRAKAESLGIDAGIVFTVVSHEQAQVASGPKGSLSIGFGGGYGGFIGGSVPIGGNTVETVHSVVMKGDFYQAGVAKPIWMAQYESDLSHGVDSEASVVASDTVKYLKKSKLFAKPEKK
jgi:hypothetical protein